MESSILRNRYANIAAGLFGLWLVFWLVSTFIVPVTIERPGQTDISPPGWEWVDAIVGYVWFLLLSLAVASFWLVRRSGHSAAARTSWMIGGYIGFCLSYVAIFGWSAETGLLGNIITIIFSVWVGRQVSRVSAIASIPISLSTAWVFVASVYLVELLRYNR